MYIVIVFSCKPSDVVLLFVILIGGFAARVWCYKVSTKTQLQQADSWTAPRRGRVGSNVRTDLHLVHVLSYFMLHVLG